MRSVGVLVLPCDALLFLAKNSRRNLACVRCSFLDDSISVIALAKQWRSPDKIPEASACVVSFMDTEKWRAMHVREKRLPLNMVPYAEQWVTAVREVREYTLALATHVQQTSTYEKPTISIRFPRREWKWKKYNLIEGRH